MEKPELSIGICAYNEAANIGLLLSQVSIQKLSHANIREIIVVSSGSTDGTDKIVKEFGSLERKVRLITERQRRGKVSAVNKILNAAKGDIIVLCGADLCLEPDTFDLLVARLSDKKVGMTGARPVPSNNSKKFPGFCSCLLWELHHRVALQSPKCGELIAFRNLGYSIPAGMPVDEAYLESRFRQDGWSIAYAADAIVRNKGPETISDYLKQRRRVHALHLYLKKMTGYCVSTSNIPAVVGAVAAKIRNDPGSVFFCGGAIMLEALSAALGAYDFHIRKEYHRVWDVSESTKVIS